MIGIAPGRTSDQALTSSEASAAVMPAPRMTLIIDGPVNSERFREHLRELRQSLISGTEIRVVTAAPWADQPPQVQSVISKSTSRGDRFDHATESASGDLLAFVDGSLTISPEWQRRALELFKDPSVGAAGGPQLLPARASTRERASSLVLSSLFGAGPLAYRFKRARSRDVLEMPTTNLVVRRSAFEAVGGFQSPSPLGDDARLCYKLRQLEGLRVVYDPGLAVHGPLPGFGSPLFSLLLQWGRKRGDLARRLPETSRGVPHLFPALWLLALLTLLAGALFSPVARVPLLGAAVAYGFAGLWELARSRDIGAGILAMVGLPLSHLAYSFGFWRGYLGHNLGETFPGRFRSPPLRILVMNWRDITHPWAGGAEGYAHELARRWVRQGCDVGWLCGRYAGARREEVIDGIHVHRVGGHFTLYPLAALTYLLRLRRRYDLIVDCENGIPFFSPLYTRKPVILVVHHVHAEVFRTELPQHLRRLALFLEGWLMPRVYRHTQVVTVSASTRTDLERAGWSSERISVVSNGVDLPDPQETDQRAAVPVLLYLGRLKRYKSVDVLLRAMPAVLARFPQAQLAIVGQGTERERLERLAWRLGLAGRVRFHGYLDRARKESLLARAWVAVYPSAFEGFGVSCLEANAWGMPVLAARVPGLKDAVVDGQTGQLLPYGDSECLAAALTSLLADPVRRRAMGDAGRQWAAAHSWDVSADLFLAKVRAAVPARVAAPALRPA